MVSIINSETKRILRSVSFFGGALILAALLIWFTFSALSAQSLGIAPIKGSDNIASESGVVLASQNITTTGQYKIVGPAGSGSISASPAKNFWPSGVITTTATLSACTGRRITLTASTDAGSRFMGWSGACTGTGNCVVTADAAKSVTATFIKSTFMPFMEK